MTCGLPFGSYLPSSISVLSCTVSALGAYLILMISRSIDPAALPSDNHRIMGLGSAVVGTPGSLSDVRRKFVLLPRPLGDSVRFIARLRSVAIYWLVNQRHEYHTPAHRLSGEGCDSIEAPREETQKH